MTSDELVKYSASRLALLIGRREVSPVEVVEAHLSRIALLNPKLNAIVTLAPDALERAREAEAALMHGEEPGPLHGVPVTIKDTIDTKGLRTTSGSILRASNIPAEDAPVVASLRSAGAIVIGKTNVSEMAIPYECYNPVFGRTLNPHDAARTPGGSSGGEGAAISSCMSPAGLGSDLSGSIRVPAHFCGIVGLKPTAGRVPTAGHFPPVEGALAEGATIGPMARHVEDLSLMLRVLTGRGGVEVWKELKGRRVASFLPEARGYATEETRRAVRRALAALQGAGLEVVYEEPPGLERAMELWPALFLAESTRQLREFYEGREESGGLLVSAALEAGARVGRRPEDELLSARSERDAVKASLLSWMERVPLIVAPVGAVPAFEHRARKVSVEGEVISLFRAFKYARAANVLGLPSAAVPAGRSPEGLPIGVQIIGRPYEDERVLYAASILEASLGGGAASSG